MALSWGFSFMPSALAMALGSAGILSLSYLRGDSHACACLSFSLQVTYSLPAGLGAWAGVVEPWHLALLQPAAPSNLKPRATRLAEGCWAAGSAQTGATCRTLSATRAAAHV